MESEKVVVRVKQGQLRGVIDQGVYGERYLAFRGVPYAKPPVGPLRFKDPEEPEPWTGVRDASEFGSNCAQNHMMTRQFVGSDDCLYLNVYRPVEKGNKKRAVMVWIHGGGFIFGSGDSEIYGPDYLLRKDIILVTINYRVGVLGFLNLEHEVATGNQGLKDQAMALKWVQQNISSFDGDPNNVTIFGESAGGASVHYLTLSPLAQGLFHKAISQSGVAINYWALLSNEPSKYGYQLAAKLGEHSTDPNTVIEFLRTIDAKELIAADKELIPPIERHVVFSRFIPTIDDKSRNPFMPKHPSLMMKEVDIKVPYLLGHNDNEGSLFLSPFNLVMGIKETNQGENLRAINENFETVLTIELKYQLKKENIEPNEVKRLYFGDEPITEKAMQKYADYISDVFFLRGIYEFIDVQLEKATQPTYFYQFTFDENSLIKNMFNIPLPGAAHSDDLAYLFYPHLQKNLNMPPVEVGSTKYKMIERLTQMWTDFAKTGNPTPKITDLIETRWQPIDKSSASYLYLNIDKTLEMKTCSREGRIFDWKKLKNKL